MPTDLPARRPKPLVQRPRFGLGAMSILLAGIAALEVFVLARAGESGAATFSFAAALLRAP